MSTRFMPEGWTLPALDDANRAFFTSGRLLVQECTSCKAVNHPPTEVCSSCQGMDFGSRETAGTGTVYSYVVAHHPANPALADRVPYAVVLVELDDVPGVRITGNLLDVPPERVAIGMPVRAVFERIEAEGETILLPQWESAGHGG